MPSKKSKKVAKKKVAKKLTKKSVASKSKESINITVGRFGSDPVTIKVVKGATVSEAIRVWGVSLGTRERVWLNGAKTTPKTKVEAGDVLAVVSPKQAGR